MMQSSLYGVNGPKHRLEHVIVLVAAVESQTLDVLRVSVTLPSPSRPGLALNLYLNTTITLNVPCKRYDTTNPYQPRDKFTSSPRPKLSHFYACKIW